MFTMESRTSAFILYALLIINGQVDLTFASKNGCYMLSSDIVFAVDSSYSIRPENYEHQLAFLRALIDKFTIGQNNIQVGVVSFASTVRLDIKLNDYNNNRDLKEAVSNIKQLSSGTHTQDAIHFIHTAMYESANGARPWAKKQLVLITDGLSSNTSATLLEASIARSKGIEVFSILVGEGVQDLETRGIASEPKDHHLFKVDDFQALAGIERALSSAACESTDSGYFDNNGGSTHSTSDACNRTAADVIFLMDSSNSIWEPHFRAQIRFIQQVVSSFDISKDATRVGVIAYSDAPITVVGLSDKQTPEHINQALANAPYITGGTDTASAIKQARKQLSISNTRPNAAHVIIILSDGQSKDTKETIAEASIAHAENVYIFAIGIGHKAEASELMAMASDPDDKFVFYVDDYKALSEIKELLAVKTCDVSLSMIQNDKDQTSCPGGPTDVLFMYDTAALNRHHHDYVISVITEITDSSRLNSQELRVGVLREASSDSDSVLHDIALTNQWTEPAFKTQLDPDSHTSSIDVLLRRARHNYFRPSFQLDYSQHNRTIVLFLDSYLSNSYAATIEAIRLRRSHVNIVVIALGKQINRMEVLGLASSPPDMYVINAPSVEDYPVYEAVSKLLVVLCQSSQST